MSEETINRAVWLSAFDKPLQVTELPVPTATPGSAVIKILAALIVPYTNLVFNGTIPLGLEPPLVPNPGAIGRVHSVGSDSVHLKEGDFVFVDSVVRARDDSNVVVMQGYHGGTGSDAHKKLMKEWRNGSLQQYQKVPLENVFSVDEQRLLGELKYSPAELVATKLYLVAAGGIMEAGDVKAGTTVVIGPSGGSFSGAAVEVALALGANVIALGRNEKKLADMKEKLGNPYRLQYIATTGNTEQDTAAILKTTPGGTGADVYNDWTPGGLPESPYLAAASGAVKRGGKVVLSGGAGGVTAIPYIKLVLEDLTVKGQYMFSSETVRRVISLVTAGTLKIGKESGTEIAVYGLDEHDEAIENAAKVGGWRNYTVIAPSTE